jgi:hypothetical protein
MIFIVTDFKGYTVNIEAEFFRVADGHLLFQNGAMMTQAFAPGTWARVR